MVSVHGSDGLFVHETWKDNGPRMCQEDKVTKSTIGEMNSESVHLVRCENSAGAMIFVSIHELLPMARRYRRPTHFVCGAASSIAVYAILNTLIPK